MTNTPALPKVPETTGVPHVYTALAKVLKHLSVDKSGQLPGNMGNGKYMPAGAISNEVKKQFSEHDLILIANEESLKNDVEVVDGRAFKIFTSIRGEYTIVSTQDASSVEISGVGDGLASNTAVSSNIASTNALKNALLRTFLISEDSVEEASMKDQSVAKGGGNPGNAALRQVKTSSAPSRGIERADGADLNDLKKKIRDWASETEGGKERAQAVMSKYKLAGETGIQLNQSVIAELGIE